MIKGYYINLEESETRKRILLNNLEEQGIKQNYQRFNAIKGDPEESSQLNLRAGELGLWKSWMELLRQETHNAQDNYHYLHIIEDDVVMDKTTAKGLKAIEIHDEDFDILFTDMYVNPNIHMQLSKYCKRLSRKGQVRIESNIYTGCTSSVIIKKEKIQKIYQILEEYMDKRGDKIPLDNYIRRLTNSKKIAVRCMIPFITSVRLDQIQNSTIQETELNHKAISISQELCGLMRRDLSYIENPSDMYSQMGKCIHELERILSKKQPGKRSIDMVDVISKYCMDNELLRYKYEPRLLEEEMNAQTNKKRF